jgi:hypothetical protein
VRNSGISIVTRRAAGRSDRLDLTTIAAGKLIESRGRAALHLLDERADLAEELGHRVAATAWRDMADAAAEILQIERDSPPIPAIIARRLPRVWLR